MSHSEQTCFADRATFFRASVTENVRVAESTYRVRFDCPRLAQSIVPGQFLMIRLADCDDPILGRPFALYDTVVDPTGKPVGVDVVYLVVGKLTGKLAQYRPGQELEVWGPLGNGFSPHATEHLIMVAGGIGQTPFLALAQEALGKKRYGDPARHAPTVPRVTLCYGARRAAYLAGVEDFARLGVEVQVSTDDGSAGHHGLVTALVERALDQQQAQSSGSVRLVGCGPEKMMHALAQLAARREIPCELSLETPMACGLGICFSCVARVRHSDGTWDYRRTCVEGPVFDAQAIEF